MSFRRIVTVVALLSIVSLPALAELTPYQQGIQEGLKAGFRMGQAYQIALDGKTSDYNKMVEPFNARLKEIFADNATAYSLFMMQPIDNTQAGTTNSLTPYSKYTSKVAKPIHAVDGSWNQSQTSVPAEDPNLRYGDMPLSAVYTWMGNNAAVPDAVRDSNGVGAGDAMGWV